MNEEERIDLLKKLNLIALLCRYDLESEEEMRIALEGVESIIADIINMVIEE